MSEKKCPVTYTLPAELVEKLDKYSRRTGVSRSHLVEDAIRNELKLRESVK
jgi:metal-responsive CopG/Arc/MetJ family transcriptional regulator